MLQPLSRNGSSVKGCILHPFDRSGIFGPVPAWWYSVLCMKSSTYPLLTLWHKHLLYPNVYTAVTILLAKRIRPEIGTSIKHHSNAVSWSRAIEIFKSYARIGNSARRCVAALVQKPDSIIGEQPIRWSLRRSSVTLLRIVGSRNRCLAAMDPSSQCGQGRPTLLRDFPADYTFSSTRRALAAQRA